jgi:hypothetical protein
MITRYKSIKSIIAKLYRDLGSSTEMNESHVVEWIAEALSRIGSFYQYETLNECIEIDESGKAKLPDNFYRLIDISYQGKPLHWASVSALTDYACQGCTVPLTCDNCSNNTFYINDCYLITDIKPQTVDSNNPKLICISYLGIPVDSEGYPKIPDDTYYDEALASYVTYRIDYRDWRKGNTTDKVYQESEKNWLFYVNSARGSANMPSIAQLETLKNTWVRLIPKQNEYNTFFSNTYNQEKRYRH